MRIGIVTDSSCDLPRSFFDENHIVIMPNAVMGPEGEYIDNRDPASTQAYYAKVLDAGESSFDTRPLSADEIRDLFLSRLVLEFDYVFCITTTRSRSKIYENATSASLRILSDYRPIREEAGIKAPFSLRVFDSGNMFTGQGLIVAEVARLARDEVSTLDVIRQMERLSLHTQAFVVPANLGRLRKQASRRGDRSIGLVSYMLGSALDIKPILRAYRGDTSPVVKVRGFASGCDTLFDAAIQEIKRGLIAPTLCVSYGGDIREVEQMPGYQALLKEARLHQLNVYLSDMSSTAAVNLGVGALSLAFASEREVTFA